MKYICTPWRLSGNSCVALSEELGILSSEHMLTGWSVPGHAIGMMLGKVCGWFLPDERESGGGGWDGETVFNQKYSRVSLRRNVRPAFSSTPFAILGDASLPSSKKRP